MTARSCRYLGSLVALAVLLGSPAHPADAAKKALHISSSPGMRTDLLEEAGFAVELRPYIPQDLTPWDLVLVQSYDACSHQTADYVKDYLAMGGGVVLGGGTPWAFCGGTDLSYIEDWFGASRYGNAGSPGCVGRVTIDNPVGTSFQVGDIVARCDVWGCAAISSLSPDATQLAKWSCTNTTMAFTHESGSGRMHYQAGLGSSSIEESKTLFKAGAQWATTPVLPGVPRYIWNYGCSPTCGGMVVAYWDRRHGYHDLAAGTLPMYDNAYNGNDEVRALDIYPGGTRPSGDFNAVDSLIASFEHARDFWVGLGQLADHNPLGHYPANCVADFMHANMGTTWLYPLSVSDGNTVSFFVENGLRSYAASKGYDFAASWISPSWDQVEREIDLRHPVILHGTIPGLGKHDVVAYGYRENPDGKWVAVHDTWDPNTPNHGWGIASELEPRGDDVIEWWKWDNPGFVIDNMTLFAPSTENTIDTFVWDTFSFLGGDTPLAYDVDPGQGNGVADIVQSPINAAENVLRLHNPDPDLVAVEAGVSVSEIMCIKFDYLFAEDGKISVMLDDVPVCSLLCPEHGPVYVDNLALTNPNAVPEPATVALLAAGGLSILGLRRHAR